MTATPSSKYTADAVSIERLLRLLDGNLAPVCPGTAPRAANGCCWRNGVSEEIDNYNGPNVVDEDADLDEGEELLEIVCSFDEAGCKAADSGDWGDEYETGDSTAVDTVRFFAKIKSTVEHVGAAEEQASEGPSGDKTKRTSSWATRRTSH